MLEFKPLTLDDKDLFEKYIKPYNFSTCEYSFLSLFLWRKGCEIHYSIINDVLIIKKVDFNHSSHFMQPLGYKMKDLKEIVDTLIEYKKENNMDYLFKDAELNFINDLKEVYGDSLEILEDRDGADYIYLREDLVKLSGKKYHAKKNHYNAFVKKYNYKAVPITEDIVDDCLMAGREWCNKNDCKGYVLYELFGIKDLLKNIAKINFVGMAVYVDDKISAFTIGEVVNENTAIIHIEKADADVRGLYAFVNRHFLEEYLPSVTYVNREQDLGIEGLRKAKLSYNPVELVMKYIVK
ncbi:hypothetical protein JOC70_002253 [Clostridium pascui]|uniref:DUF2156 domain-containing protein n=1 Tax=Clostridium pascui TaxID=46609 RepID=UPI00195D76A0|nr:phosphatidylglycerol lysyltransferase domain-containing protein [Clostridium pascui]MBM7870759.1 hypothetical protein [Clostridium pascui]